MRRGIAVLAVAALGSGAFAATPAFSAKTVTKKTVKKIVRSLGGTLFIDEASELDRFGPIKLSVGQSAPIGTYGPFTLSADCQQGDFDMDGPPFENRARILIDTSEDDSAFESNVDSDEDFDAADPPAAWAEDSQPIGDPSLGSENQERAQAEAPSGAWMTAVANIAAVNFGGVDCQLAGAVLTSA